MQRLPKIPKYMENKMYAAYHKKQKNLFIFFAAFHE